MVNINSLQSEITGTWRINHRINLRLLDALTDEQLAATIRPRGKSVTSYFVHIHMARFYWLERRSRVLAKRLKKIPAGTASRADLRQALIDSSTAMEEFLAEAAGTGIVKSSKLGPVGFLGYALAHEAHHRGQVLLHLKVAKLPLDRDTGHSLWYWTKI
jgi:uncharacterized damage-inducible protein DinB